MKDLIPRIKALLVNPSGTWTQIEGDPETPASLLRRLILPLAAVPAVAWLLGFLVLGGGSSFLRYGISYAVALFAVNVVAVFVFAVLADRIAPKFEGESNFVQSLKWSAWGAVPAFVGGIVLIVPFLAPLAILAALYSLYVLYTGLPVLKKNPAESTLPYFAVVVIAGIVVTWVIQAIVFKAVPSPVRELSDLARVIEEQTRSYR